MFEHNNIGKFLEKNNNIQTKFLEFLDNEENTEENFQNLNQLFDDTKIRDCQHDLRLFLHMLVKVANNHHRGPDFFIKIERVLGLFIDDIKKYQNTKIFRIFKSNKRILLFLIEEKILTVDKYFIKQIIKDKYLKKFYPHYFAPEIKPFMNEKWFPKYERIKIREEEEDEEEEYVIENEWIEELKKELPKDFYELRRIGENDSYISKLIREDLVEDFIVYVTKNCISRNAIINQSIYETNSFLMKKQISLIEYATFFGSIQIFTFLKNEKVTIIPSLFLNAIHSKNAELIHLLEENLVDPTPDSSKDFKKIECFKESIKCNDINIANYFLNNYLQKEVEYSNYTVIQSLRYYNFSFLQNELINEIFFGLYCYFDYYSIAFGFMTNKKLDINKKIIQNHIIQ